MATAAAAASVIWYRSFCISVARRIDLESDSAFWLMVTSNPRWKC